MDSLDEREGQSDSISHTKQRERGKKKTEEEEEGRERERGLFYYGTLHLLPNLKSQTNQIQIKRMNNLPL